MVSSSVEIRKFFDLKDDDILERYISENKIYFRVRVRRAAQYNIRKDTVSSDILMNGGSVVSGMGPWSVGGVMDPALVVKSEEVSTLGIDYFKIESV